MNLTDTLRNHPGRTVFLLRLPQQTGLFKCTEMHFWVTKHWEGSFDPLLDIHEILAPRGSITTASLSPRLVSADDSVLTLDEDQRDCKFAHENQGLEILRTYSNAGCQFECKLRYARKKCGCTPWDYPHGNSRLLRCSFAALDWKKYCLVFQQQNLCCVISSEQSVSKKLWQMQI